MNLGKGALQVKAKAATTVKALVEAELQKEEATKGVKVKGVRAVRR